MKPENHDFGVPTWPAQDFLLIETVATSREHILTKPAKHTGPGLPRWRRWLQNFISRIYCMCDPVLFRSVEPIE